MARLWILVYCQRKRFNRRVNRQIGISVASLDRMFFVFREAVNLNDYAKLSLGGRCNPKLTSAQLFINNLAIPQRPLKG